MFTYNGKYSFFLLVSFVLLYNCNKHVKESNEIIENQVNNVADSASIVDLFIKPYDSFQIYIKELNVLFVRDVSSLMKFCDTNSLLNAKPILGNSLEDELNKRKKEFYNQKSIPCIFKLNSTFFSQISFNIESDTVKKISYLFHDELNDSLHQQIIKILIKYFGKPDLNFTYKEHVLSHIIDVWENDNYILKYDIGQIEGYTINDETDSAAFIKTEKRVFPISLSFELSK